jgi:hypothetical protein
MPSLIWPPRLATTAGHHGRKICKANIEGMNATSEIVNRAIKYLVEGLFVAVAAIFVPRHRLPWDEILTLGVVAAAVFAILDVVSPSIGATARQGAGFGIGANLVGFPGARL